MKNKKADKQIIKKTSPEAQKESLEQVKKYFSNPEIFSFEENKLEEYLKDPDNNSGKKSKPTIFTQLKMMYCLENGALVNSLSRSQYGPALSRMRKKLVDENDCKSSIELMLVDRIISSYWRAMRADTAYHMLVEPEDGVFSFDQLKINVLKEINKTIDQANREFSNNIILLKELKQPNLKVTLKTDNAYFAENQQVINNKDGENLKADTEIIKGK